MNHTILLIEDDKELATLITTFLQKNGFNVIGADSVKAFNALHIEHDPDIILCDVMLPDGDGFELFPSIRRRFSSPILFLTALDSDRSQIKGLNIGANDYLTKPIRPEVLLARLNTTLRNFGKARAKKNIGSLQLDEVNRFLEYKSRKVSLNESELKLMEYLINRFPTPATRETLFREIIGREYDGLDRAIDLKISRLRKKMRAEHINGVDIISIRGEGYLVQVDA